jgi:hypothetical protein
MAFFSDIARNLGQMTGTNNNPYCQEACFESNDPLRTSFKNALKTLIKETDIILFGYTDRLANIFDAKETRFVKSNVANNDYYFEHIIGKFESYDENGITLTETKTNYDREWTSSGIGSKPTYDFVNDININPYHYDRIIKKPIYVKIKTKDGIQQLILEKENWKFESINDTEIIEGKSQHHENENDKDKYTKSVTEIFNNYEQPATATVLTVAEPDTAAVATVNAVATPVTEPKEELNAVPKQEQPNEQPSSNSNVIQILNSATFATSFEDSFEPKTQVLNNTMLNINGTNRELTYIADKIVLANRLTRLYMLGYDIVKQIILNDKINKTVNGAKIFPNEVKLNDDKGEQIIQNGKKYKLNASQNVAIVRLCMLYTNTTFSNEYNEALFNKTKKTVLDTFETKFKPQLETQFSSATVFDPSDLLIHSRIKKRSGVVKAFIKTNEVDYLFLKDGVFIVKDFVGGQYKEREPRREYVPFIVEGKLDFKLIQIHIDSGEKNTYNEIVKKWNNTGTYFGSNPIPEDLLTARTKNAIGNLGSQFKTGFSGLTNFGNGMKGGKPTRKRNKKQNKRTKRYYR